MAAGNNNGDNPVNNPAGNGGGGKDEGGDWFSKRLAAITALIVAVGGLSACLVATPGALDALGRFIGVVRASTPVPANTSTPVSSDGTGQPKPTNTGNVIQTGPSDGADLGTLAVDNIATQTGQRAENGFPIWQWTIFIQGSDADLNQVRCVTYHLHPTFQPPEYQVCARGPGPRAYPFTATGWGTFDVRVVVELTNGQSKELRHTLHFP